MLELFFPIDPKSNVVSQLGHAISVSGVFKNHKKRHCNIQKWNEKIDKCQFRDPKRPMKAKKADLKETVCDTDKIKDLQLRLRRLSDKKIAEHTKPTALQKVSEKTPKLKPKSVKVNAEKTPNQKPKHLFDICTSCILIYDVLKEYLIFLTFNFIAFAKFRKLF